MASQERSALSLVPDHGPDMPLASEQKKARTDRLTPVRWCAPSLCATRGMDGTVQ